MTFTACCYRQSVVMKTILKQIPGLTDEQMQEAASLDMQRHGIVTEMSVLSGRLQKFGASVGLRMQWASLNHDAITMYRRIVTWCEGIGPCADAAKAEAAEMVEEIEQRLGAA